jgi:hypothetical protein
MKQGVVFVEDTTVEDKAIGVIFCIFIMYAILVFFSKYLIQEETAPITITDAQFDLLTNKSKLPEGFDNQTIATTGDDYLNPANLNIKELDSLTGLQECPEGECAIDLKTGIKRCPQNDNTRIVYNQAFEGCSAKFFCTNDDLPYAVRSSGETDTFGVCETDIECRCTDQVVCPKFVVSSFNLYNGSSFTGLRKDLNYYFDQTTLADDKIVGYDSIVIPSERTNVQFCNINPSYLDRLAGGCNFNNGDNDILGCNDSEDFLQISSENFTKNIGSSLPINYQNNPQNNFKTLGYQNSLNIGAAGQSEERKPGKGYGQYLDSDIIRFISYGSNAMNSETINDQNISSLGSVFGWAFDTTVDGGNISANVGISPDITNVDPENPPAVSIDFMNIIYTGCTDSSGTDVSNKNMLLCTQYDTQPCKEGVFAYRVDTKPASSFCQYNPTLPEYIANDGDFQKALPIPPPLDDPQFFTLSCVTGPGCNGGYSQSFCKDGDCTTAIDRYRTIFQDYDDSAVNGVWEIRQIAAVSPPEAGVISFSYDESKGIVLRNDGLITVQSGDYFSTVKQMFQKLLIKTVTNPVVGTVVKFFLGSVDGLESGYSIYASGFKGVIIASGIDTDNNTVEVDPEYVSGITSIPAYTLIDGYKPLSASGDGNDFGIFLVQPNKILPAKLDGTLTTFSSVPDTIFLYKQFGFNGPNYNSEINFTFNVPAQGSPYFTTKRTYTTLSQWSYWLESFRLTIPDVLTVPLSSPVVPIVIQTETNKTTNPNSKSIDRESINSVVFSTPVADFKEDLSFYYPVWDQNKNDQTCIKCKPALYTYMKINADSQISSAIIQFSGKDFGQYMYYPQFGIDSTTNVYITNYDESPFIFNVLTSISQDVFSSTKRIVLQNPNPNLVYSSDVDSDYYTNNPYYVLDGNNTINRLFYPVQQATVNQGTVFPLSGKPASITLDTVPLQSGVDQNVLLDDCYVPFTFGSKILQPNTTQELSLDATTQQYANLTSVPDSNWFAGKKYFAGQNMILIKGQTKIISVELINGKQVIYTDSVTNVAINKTSDSDNNATVIQIYSENDTLDLEFDQDMTNQDNITQQVMPDSITDNRITSLVFPQDIGIIKDIEALPAIIFSKYRNLQ